MVYMDVDIYMDGRVNHTRLQVVGLAQGHLATQLGGAGDRTRNLPVAVYLLYIFILTNMYKYISLSSIE